MTPSYISGPAGPAGRRRAATFAGASVFLSGNLVAPEMFDAVHDALRLNGAEVLLCADPSRTGPLEFHVISSSSHVRRRALAYSPLLFHGGNQTAVPLSRSLIPLGSVLM